MCIDVPIHQAELSRRGLLGLGGLGAAAAGAGTLVTSAPAAAAPPAALGHRHSSRVVLLGVAGGPPPEIDRAGIASALVPPAELLPPGLGRPRRRAWRSACRTRVQRDGSEVNW